jgi:acyl dehydratase
MHADDHGDDDREETLADADGDGTGTVEVSDGGPTVGDRVTFTKRLAADDVRAFATASGDTNRLHLDAGFAEATRFEGPIVHGALVAGLVSAALARLPGLVIYLSQELRFVGPVPVGDTPTATAEVVEELSGGRLRLAIEVVRSDGEPAVDGEAVVLIDEPPEGGRG